MSVPGAARVGPEDVEAIGALYRRHVNTGHAMLSSVISGHLEAGADGCLVFDEEGGDHLDCGGHGVFLLGHRHPRVVEAVRDQLGHQPMQTRFLLNPVVARAAERLAGVAPDGLEQVFFHSSGAEAVEMAIKLGRASGRPHVVAMDGGFHGKTTGALSLASRAAYVDPFRPLLDGVSHVPFGDAAALDAELAARPGGATVILEPVQGEAGVRLPPPGWLRAVQESCARHDALLVLDEIQSGLGRVGAWWAADLDGVRPDVLLAGKILGGGVLPVSAVIATPAAYAPLDRDPWLHSSTFGNAPVLAAAAHATLDVLRDEDLVARSAALGARLLRDLRAVADEHGRGLVTDVRGLGLLLGIEFAEPAVAGEFTFDLVGRRVLPSYALNSAATVRLTPSALLEEHHVERLLEAVAEALRSTGDRVGRGD